MMTIEETANILEGILFLSPTIVKINALQEHLNVDAGILHEAMDHLKRRFEGTGLELMNTAGGFEIATRKEYSDHLKAYFGKMDKTRLSRASLETLAIIAYNQPVSRTDIERIRGVNTSGVTRSLLDRGLIKISGKGDGVGRPFLFATTPEFLRFMGIDSLEDLPPLESFEQKV